VAGSCASLSPPVAATTGRPTRCAGAVSAYPTGARHAVRTADRWTDDDMAMRARRRGGLTVATLVPRGRLARRVRRYRAPPRPGDASASGGPPASSGGRPPRPGASTAGTPSPPKEAAAAERTMSAGIMGLTSAAPVATTPPTRYDSHVRARARRRRAGWARPRKGSRLRAA